MQEHKKLDQAQVPKVTLQFVCNYSSRKQTVWYLGLYSHDFSALALMVYFLRRLFTVDELKLVLSLITVGFNFTLNTSAAESNADMLIKTTKSGEQKVQNNARLNSFFDLLDF